MSAGHTQGSVYDKLFQNSVSARQNQENAASSSSKIEIKSNKNGNEAIKKRRLLRSPPIIKLFVGFMIGLVVGASISSLVFSALLKLEANKIRRSELLLEYANKINANKTVAMIELDMQLKELNHRCAKTNISVHSNATKTGHLKTIISCHVIPISSPSGSYWVCSSNGSTIRVSCAMKKMCGNITGGWMRVTSLDMSQPSSKCPSSLCLKTTTPHTCRRCYNDAEKVPWATYDVGVTYSHVCGRIIAYQVGRPDGYR